MRKMVKIILVGIIAIYVIGSVILYIGQEDLMFFPTKLSNEYVYNFDAAFEEINLNTIDDIIINSLLFKSNESKGVVLFLHGNGGSIAGWGKGSNIYTNNGYDILYIDYRGYGKSSGTILGESQLIEDAQLAYDYLKERYSEENIIVSGTSIGTGIASKIASVNNPKKLILISPYFSLHSLINEKMKIFPSLIMKYKFATNKFLKKVDCPIFIIHGTEDRIIPINHSMQLKKEFDNIHFNQLKGYGHNDLSESIEYLKTMDEILKD